MFYVANRNGQGGLRSDWYLIGGAHANKEDAVAAAQKYAAENPECNGWNVEIAVLNNHPMYGDDDDCEVVKWIR